MTDLVTLFRRVRARMAPTVESDTNEVRILSAAQLKRLREHKYSAVSVSLLDPILQIWWTWLVTKVPVWLAPNLITVLGLIVNIVSSLILIFYSPDCKQEVRRKVSFPLRHVFLITCALCSRRPRGLFICALWGFSFTKV